MSSKLSIGFLGSPDFTADILSFIISNRLAEVKVVWSGLDKKRGRGQKLQKTKIHKVSDAHKISIYQVEDLGDCIEEQVEIVKKLKLDLLFVVAYGYLLPELFFQSPTYGSVNLHFSLLPRYRGASPMQTCILKGDDISGVTLQKIAKKLDSGDILLRESFDIFHLDIREIFAKSLLASQKLLFAFFKNHLHYFTNSQPQNPNDVTYSRKIKKKDGLVIGTDTAIVVKRKFLAYQFWPKTFFYLNNIQYTLESLSLLSECKQNLIDRYRDHYQKMPFAKGYLYRFDNYLLLTLSDASEDAILIAKIQKQGKKAISVKDFLNGIRWQFPLAIDSNSVL